MLLDTGRSSYALKLVAVAFLLAFAASACFLCLSLRGESFKDARYSRLLARPALGTVRIAIVTYFSLDDYGNKLRPITIKNQRDYAKRHGYDFVDVSEELDIVEEIEALRGQYRNIYYFKMIGLGALLDKYDWLMWCDADSIFLNFHKRLEDIIDNRYDVIVTVGPPSDPKWGGIINAGHFLIRNSDFSRSFLNRALELSKGDCNEYFEKRPMLSRVANGWLQVCVDDGLWWFGDQGLFYVLYALEPLEYTCHFKRTPLRIFNSEFYRYGEGDLVLHFPRLDNDYRRDLIPRFLALVDHEGGFFKEPLPDELLPSNETRPVLSYAEIDELYLSLNPVCSK